MNRQEMQPWQSVNVSTNPTVVLGRRRRGALECGILNVDESLFEPFRISARSALDRLQRTTPRAYASSTSIESDVSHFTLTRADIDALARRDGEDAAQPDNTAALVDTLSDPSQHDALDRDQFENFQNPLFYSVCWQQDDDSWVSFVRKANPKILFKPGRRWLRYDGTLRDIEHEPRFLLEDRYDLVVHPEQIASFSGEAMKNLFNDVKLMMREVPQYVESIESRLTTRIPLTNASAAALRTRCANRPSLARRLYELPDRLDSLAAANRLNVQFLRQLAESDSEIAGICDSSGGFSFDESTVEIFLDTLEGRFFEEAWTGERRRADSYSKR